MTEIPFNSPYMTGREFEYIRQACAARQLSGNGHFTKTCQQWLQQTIGCEKALLTHSGTAALEMSALLADIGPGDEVIMPSFTFVSTANAFVLRGALPVFVDIRGDSLNLDETKIEAAITDKTKAIVVVHYAGVACDMRAIMRIAQRHGLIVIEDAAHAFLAEYDNRQLGGIGHMAAFSFHETKNITCGEGGALLLNDPRLIHRAEIIWEKGTNRAAFFRGEVDKYTWVDIGSSYLPGELGAAFLWAQFEESQEITRRRVAIWDRYQDAFERLEQQGLATRPRVPPLCRHNAHLYYLLLSNLDARQRFISTLRQRGVHTVFHYAPLHSAPAGKSLSRVSGDLSITQNVSEALVRLPLWVGVEAHVERIIAEVCHCLESSLQRAAA